MRSELLLGCGNNRAKKIHWTGTDAEWQQLTTVDIDPACKPDIVHDLNVLPYPFADNTFDEIHAYEVMEHVGQQGDWRFFFAQFDELHRILKPGGFFVATVPMWDSPWAWGDPGHTRVIPREALIFLDRREYAQVGTTSITDYRSAFRGHFETMSLHETDHTLGFILRCIKGDVIPTPHVDSD